MRFNENNEYLSELKEISSDYRNIHSKYGEIVGELDALNEKISELELLRSEYDMKLEMNRKREKEFLAMVKNDDPEAYEDLLNNVMNYIK